MYVFTVVSSLCVNSKIPYPQVCTWEHNSVMCAFVDVWKYGCQF